MSLTVIMSSAPTIYLPTKSVYYTPEDYSEKYYYNPPNLLDNEKLHDVSIKVEEVKSTLHHAIDKTIARGEQLEETERKAQEIENNSNRFYRGAHNLKCMFCKQNVRTIGCIILILVIVIFIIAMIAKSYSN